MPACVGIDLSSKAIDLVKLDEETNAAEWVRCELVGRDAWQRTMMMWEHLTLMLPHRWFEDVYLCAIEAPYGRGQAGTNAILNRVVGGLGVMMPAELRCNGAVWIVRPDEWKAGLGLKAKPTHGDLETLAPDIDWFLHEHKPIARDQNARDAYCLAMWARDTNAKAVSAALEKDTAA